MFSYNIYLIYSRTGFKKKPCHSLFVSQCYSGIWRNQQGRASARDEADNEGLFICIFQHRDNIFCPFYSSLIRHRVRRLHHLYPFQPCCVPILHYYFPIINDIPQDGFHCLCHWGSCLTCPNHDDIFKMIQIVGYVSNVEIFAIETHGLQNKPIWIYSLHTCKKYRMEFFSFHKRYVFLSPLNFQEDGSNHFVTKCALLFSCQHCSLCPSQKGFSLP